MVLTAYLLKMSPAVAENDAVREVRVTQDWKMLDWKTKTVPRTSGESQVINQDTASERFHVVKCFLFSVKCHFIKNLRMSCDHMLEEIL